MLLRRLGWTPCLGHFWIVLLATCHPNFSNSPLIRSAPQLEFSWAICLISTTICFDSGGLPLLLDLSRDLTPDDADKLAGFKDQGR